MPKIYAFILIMLAYTLFAEPLQAAAQTHASAAPILDRIHAERQSALVTDLIKYTALQTGQSIWKVTEQLKEGKTLTQVAEAAGKSSTDIIQAARSALKARLDKAVKAKSMRQAKADQLLTEFDQAAPLVMQNSNLFPHKATANDALIARVRLMLLDGAIKATALQTKQTVAEIKAQLKAGKSLEQIITAAGVKPDDIIALVRAEFKARLDLAVRLKQLTQATADSYLAQYDKEAPVLMQDTTLGKRL